MNGPSFDDVASFWALWRALDRAARGKRRKKSVAEVLIERESVLLRLEEELYAGTYRPAGYRTFRIYEPKPRIISAAPFRDRIVHHALMGALEPLLERAAIADSFACRPKKGGLRALRRVQELARQWPYVLRLDIAKFFASVDHDRLLDRLRRLVADEDLRALMASFVRLGAPGCPAGVGLPVGNLTSQHFANDFLGAMDDHARDHLGFGGWVRYLDDVVVFGADKAALWAGVSRLSTFLREDLALQLNARVTRVFPVTEGIAFLGFRIWPNHVRLDGPHFRRLRRRLRRLEGCIDRGRLSEDDAVRSASGLMGYGSHAHAGTLRNATAE